MDEKFYVREVEFRYKGEPKEAKKISSPEDVHKFFQCTLNDVAEEHFCALYLNQKNALLGWKIISIGTLNESLIHPRETFIGAISLNASAVIVVHNHPSGSLSPSGEDIQTTKRLLEAGNILGITLTDHVIVSFLGYYSMKEHGYL